MLRRRGDRRRFLFGLCPATRIGFALVEQGPLPVETRDVGRVMGSCVAVRQASVRLEPGRIHAIVGENGAGKSTLLKMMAGAVVPSSGEVWVGERLLSPATQAEAIRRGVGLVYQHFSLVETMTGLENLMLGFEPVGRFGVLQPQRLERRAAEVAARTGLSLRLRELVSRMSVGEKQRLEILRVLVRGARAILLDEPTAVLTPGEARSLFSLLRRVADDGATVAVVTHHLDEVVEHCDDLTVMRKGEVVHRGSTEGQSVASLARLALGDIATIAPPEAVSRDAPTLLEVKGVRTPVAGGAALDDVSLSLRGGEVLGVAGVDGNGQDALVGAICGLVPVIAGKVLLSGIDITNKSVLGRRQAGLETIHGDRHRLGLVEGASLADNLILGDFGLDDERAVALRRLAASGVRPAAPDALASSLSGGNQQKLVVERALARGPKVLVAAYPTRGIDAAVAATVQRALIDAAKSGAAVLVISGDLAELRAVSHRLLVLSRGRVAAELLPSDSEDAIGAAMLGGEPGAHAEGQGSA